MKNLKFLSLGLIFALSCSVVQASPPASSIIKKESSQFKLTDPQTIVLQPPAVPHAEFCDLVSQALPKVKFEVPVGVNAPPLFAITEDENLCTRFKDPPLHNDNAILQTHTDIDKECAPLNDWANEPPNINADDESGMHALYRRHS